VESLFALHPLTMGETYSSLETSFQISKTVLVEINSSDVEELDDKSFTDAL
jgi:hypothetical protein